MWWWFAGCFHAGLHVRPGEVLPPGEVALEADGTPLTLAPGSVRLGDDELHATFGARQMLHPVMAMYIPPYAVGGGLRVGIGRGLELVGNLAAQEAAGGFRVALANHVALSASGGVYPSWFPLAANPRGTLTVDGSVQQLRVQLGASVGEQVYVGFPPARWTTDCGSFGQAGCGEYSPGPVPKRPPGGSVAGLLRERAAPVRRDLPVVGAGTVVLVGRGEPRDGVPRLTRCL